MKIIDQEHMEDERYRKLSLREAMLLNNFEHTNVIKVRDYFKTQTGNFCIVMDYAECYTLNQLVKNIEDVKRKHENLAKEIYTQQNG